MQSKWLPVLVPALSMAGCVAKAALELQSRHCLAQLCSDSPMSHALDMLLITALLLNARGLARGGWQLWRTHRALRLMLSAAGADLPESLAQIVCQLGLAGRVRLSPSATPTAFCYGMLRPNICVTAGLVQVLAPPELAAVLQHEQHHLRHRDPLRILLWTIASGSCWWLEARAEQSHLTRELKADQTVIASGGRLHLASALLKLLTEPGAALPPSNIAVSAISTTDARIEQMLHPDWTLPDAPLGYGWLLLPATVLSITLFCAFVLHPLLA